MILQIALNDNRYMKPIVRIKGFEKDWISCLLSDCLTICNERNHQLQYGKKDALSVSDEYGVVNQIQHLGRSYAGKDVSGYKILRKNQIVYTKSPLKQKPYGIIKVNDNEDGIVSVLYAVYDTQNGICPDFLNRYFEPHGRINKYLIPIINKGAKNTINVSDAQALQGRINIPVSEDEQKAIAGFFSDLDKLIVASTNRVSSLRKMKAASLQAMFPQKGETRPIVRFKGFEDEYSSMTANELFKTFDERNHPELPVLSACQDIRGMVPRSESGYDIFHDKSNEVTYKCVLPGQFVIHLRSFQGGFAHSSVEGICSPAYTVFGFKEDDKHDDYYWKYIFMSKAFIDRLKLITYGIRDGRSISFKEFMEMNFVFPSYEEQKQISIFFRTIDKQISLEEQKLESLKRIKSACLDKMFV